jgi:hypothetical protein
VRYRITPGVADTGVRRAGVKETPNSAKDVTDSPKMMVENLDADLGKCRL